MITHFRGKVAVVTGAGSGIGRSMALAFADEGMHLVIADINDRTLNTVRRELAAKGADVIQKVVDVSDREQMARLAEEAYDRFGRVNVLCNNAGIGTGGLLSEVHMENWDWILGINLFGVIHGIQFFLKRMIESGEKCHIVNTGSVAGLLSSGDQALYATTKFGVVALTEALRDQQVAMKTKVGVSVLCPGFVSTNINETSGNLARDKKGLYETPEEIKKSMQIDIDNFHRRVKEGLNPDIVAQMVIDSIRKDRFFILTSPDYVPLIDLRTERIRRDALDLQQSMIERGVIDNAAPPKQYVHEAPGFSLNYPGDWVIQNPSSRTKFDFMAVSEAWYPNLVVIVSELPPTRLTDVINTAAQAIATGFGVKTEVVRTSNTTMAGSAPAVTGEIEITADNQASLINQVWAVEKSSKVIQLFLGSLKTIYDDAMKKQFQEIAASLKFH